MTATPTHDDLGPYPFVLTDTLQFDQRRNSWLGALSDGRVVEVDANSYNLALETLIPDQHMSQDRYEFHRHEAIKRLLHATNWAAGKFGYCLVGTEHVNSVEP